MPPRKRKDGILKLPVVVFSIGAEQTGPVDGVVAESSNLREDIRDAGPFSAAIIAAGAARSTAVGAYARMKSTKNTRTFSGHPGRPDWRSPLPWVSRDPQHRTNRRTGGPFERDEAVPAATGFAVL